MHWLYQLRCVQVWTVTSYSTSALVRTLPSRTRVSYNNGSGSPINSDTWVFKRKKHLKKSKSTGLVRQAKRLYSNTNSQITTLHMSGNGSGKIKTTNLKLHTQLITSVWQTIWMSSIVALKCSTHDNLLESTCQVVPLTPSPSAALGSPKHHTLESLPSFFTTATSLSLLERDINEILKKLNYCKAPGTDTVYTLKHSANQLSPVFTSSTLP